MRIWLPEERISKLTGITVKRTQNPSCDEEGESRGKGADLKYLLFKLLNFPVRELDSFPSFPFAFQESRG